MPTRAPLSFALLSLGTLLAVVVAHLAAEPESDVRLAQGAQPTQEAAPVVVELFTSQGCSSCPPADRLLSKLGREGLDGIPIIPLSFHVDYWNYIGWQDPFSHPRWSKRQEGYAQALGKGRLYTPQAVVQGMEDCVGSRPGCLEEAIARAARTPPSAALTAALEAQPGGDLAVLASVRLLPEAPAGSLRGDLEAVAVLFEKGLETPVSRGENAHKNLENDYVVRHLERIFRFSPARDRGPEAPSGRVLLHLDPKWQRDRLGVAVLLQEESSRRILAAWSQDLSL